MVLENFRAQNFPTFILRVKKKKKTAKTSHPETSPDQRSNNPEFIFEYSWIYENYFPGSPVL